MPLFDSSTDFRLPIPAGSRATRRQFDLRRLRPSDLFDAWMFAEADAALALATWRSAPRAEKRNAHAAYVAALDRETHAADVLQRRFRGLRSR